MALSNFYLTDRGNALMAQALTGTKITITRAQIGEGTWPDGTTFANVAALVAPLKDLAISRKRADSNGQTIITVQFSTDGIGRAFNWSEFALWAADPTSPDDRTKDFILGTSRALAAEEAVHFDAVKEEFNFNVILKTTNADTVEIIYEGSAVYPTLDKDGSLTLEGGLGVSNGIGTVGANSNMAVLAHHLTPGGPARYIAVSMENDLENAARLTEELEGGGSVSYDLIHTGMENPAKTIGAFPGTKLLTNSPDANELTTEGNYFLMNGLNIPKPHGFVTVLHFDGLSFAPDLSWGRTHCIRQIFRDYNTGSICERFGLLKSEISNEWEWGEWDNTLSRYGSNTVSGELFFDNLNDYYMLKKGRTLPNGKTHFLTMGLSSGGSTTLEHYTCPTENYDSSMLDGRLELGQVSGADGWLNSYALVLRGDNANGPTYRIYGEHYSPVVSATAELI